MTSAISARMSTTRITESVRSFKLRSCAGYRAADLLDVPAGALPLVGPGTSGKS